MSSSHTTLKVLVFAASLRDASLNRKLVTLAARVAEKNGAIVDVASMRDFDVPCYDGNVEASRGIPSGAKELQRRRHGLLLSASPSLAGGNRGLWALRTPLEHLGARIFLTCSRFRWRTRRSPMVISPT